MTLLKKFNETYTKLIAESIDNEDMTFKIQVGFISNLNDDSWLAQFEAKPVKNFISLDERQGKIWTLNLPENKINDFLSHKLESTEQTVCEYITDNAYKPEDFAERLPYEIFRSLSKFNSDDFSKYFQVRLSK